MDAETVLRIKPALTRYLHEFDDCFGRSQTRGHLGTYVRGQLGPLGRKSVEPMADAAGTPARTLQEFLSLSRWDEPRLRDVLQRRVSRRHASLKSVGIIDETSFVKKGDKTACVQRQHCGASGKIDNCVVSVHLGYVAPGGSGAHAGVGARAFHTLLDGELFLPRKTWDDDPDRRREAEVPDEVTYRPKWRIALDQYRRAQANGVRFRWLTFDEGYGGKPPFLRELDASGQDYVAEVPRDVHVWTQLPKVLYRRHARDMNKPGRPRAYPRLQARNNPAVAIENILRHSPKMHRQAWVAYRVKDASKGPMVWEVKHLPVYLKDEAGLPTCGGRPYHLLVARNVLKRDEVKYFISNACENTPVGRLLSVAFSRWRIERMFQDSKMELGLAHFEVRKYASISRHLLLSCVSHLFLAEFQQSHAEEGGGERGGGGKKNHADDQPDRRGHQQARPHLGTPWTLLPQHRRNHQHATDRNTTPKRQVRPQPSQANATQITRDRHQTQRDKTMPLGKDLAL